MINIDAGTAIRILALGDITRHNRSTNRLTDHPHSTHTTTKQNTSFSSSVMAMLVSTRYCSW